MSALRAINRRRAAAAGCDDLGLLRVATGYAQWGVAYEVPEGVALAELRVMNALGQLVHRQALAGKGIVELARKGTAPGLHMVGLFYDGQLVATEKLQWMR